MSSEEEDLKWRRIHYFHQSLGQLDRIHGGSDCDLIAVQLALLAAFYDVAHQDGQEESDERELRRKRMIKDEAEFAIPAKIICPHCKELIRLHAGKFE